MTQLPFTFPAQNECLPSSSGPGHSLADAIARRRSTPIKLMDLTLPGPDEKTLENILAAALRVPDHRKIEPWRLLVISGNSRIALGQFLSDRHADLTPSASKEELQTEASRLMRAPICVTVISSPDHAHKTPVWEQELSAGALCMNLLYAVSAAGFAASWISEWWAFDPEVNRKLGLTEDERIAGHVFIGQTNSELAERPRPDVTRKVTRWLAP